jgi:pimeloyl-ACP methyl ester carboxylesterase
MRTQAPVGALALAALVAAMPGIGSQVRSATWRDPARHRIQFVTVDQDVRLELLDWGGSGPPVVLLAGAGNTAHVFDDFAPKLTDCCRVYGITRRGFGASSRPSSGYDDQRLADDVLEAIDRTNIRSPILIGHSMSGGEMTTLGRQHSDRLGGLVYIDALGDLEDDPPADSEWAALQRQMPAGLLAQPSCPPIDQSTFAGFRETWGCSMGFTLPESELRFIFESVDGRVGAPAVPGWVGQAIGKGQVFRRDYSNIRVPVLALMNGAQTTDELLQASGYHPRSDEERNVIDRFMATSRVVFGRSAVKLTRHVPDARIVHYPLAGHYVFVTREAEVLREIRAFINGPIRALPK